DQRYCRHNLQLRHGFDAVIVVDGLHHRDYLDSAAGLQRTEFGRDRVEIDVDDGRPERRGHAHFARISRSARGIASAMSVARAPDSPISDASSAPARPCTQTAPAAAPSGASPRAMNAATAAPSASPEPP